jgi:predicted alpha/beta-fold hydrolase
VCSSDLFLRTLKAKALAKLERFPDLYDREAVAAIDSIHAFDNLVTAPLHGYQDADDYWRQAASKPDLGNIQVETLLLNARNDPFMHGDVLSAPEQASPWVTLDFPEQGGHAGFISGPFPGNFRWLRRRVLDFLTPCQGGENCSGFPPG